MLYLFDLDGTLISSYMDNADKNYHRWKLLPRRAARIDALRAEGHKIALITNQGGVAFGMITQGDVEWKLAEVAGELGYAGGSVWDGSQAAPVDLYSPDPPARQQSGDLAIYVCYADKRAYDPRWQVGAERRKPSGAMIREAIDARADSESVLFVGDRPEDQAAAAAAGVAFQWANEFFGD